MRLRTGILSLVLVLLFSAGLASGAVRDTDPVLEGKLESKLMGRTMPYHVYGPLGFREARDKKLPVVYLLHGLTGSYSDWFEKGDIEAVVKKYGVVVVMPEGNNGWYTDSPIKPNDKYESYIVKELIPKIEGDLSVRKDRAGRAIAGLSMGGYGGLKFGLKYPGKFVLAGSFSGALRAAEWDKTTVPAWKVLGESVYSAFGPKGSETRAENDIFKILNGLEGDELKRLPFLYLDCGTEDGLIVQNRSFSELLLKKKVPHEFRQLPGRHDWRFWHSQIGEFLELAEGFFDAKNAVAGQ
ncbi:MAG: hypothetical protein HKN33_10195 [Pyrinomonadaceae bacterium]|nr:hypothetical protein [Pyrinomonadaceae bacterium]